MAHLQTKYTHTKNISVVRCSIYDFNFIFLVASEHNPNLYQRRIFTILNNNFFKKAITSFTINDQLYYKIIENLGDLRATL